MKKIIPVLVIFAVVTSCKNNPKTGASVKSETDDIRFAGNNVTSEYQRRSEGYDWVAVEVSEIIDSIL